MMGTPLNLLPSFAFSTMSSLGAIILQSPLPRRSKRQMPDFMFFSRVRLSHGNAAGNHGQVAACHLNKVAAVGMTAAPTNCGEAKHTARNTSSILHTVAAARPCMNLGLLLTTVL